MKWNISPQVQKDFNVLDVKTKKTMHSLVGQQKKKEMYVSVEDFQQWITYLNDSILNESIDWWLRWRL